MKKTIIISLVLALATAGGFFWYFQQAPQKINSTVDQLFEAIAHKKISLRKPSDVQESLREILADELTISGISQIREPTLTLKEFTTFVLNLHEFTSLCEFSEHDRSHQIAGNKAQVYCTTTIIVAAGPNTRTEQKQEFTFDLENTDRWRITAIRVIDSSE